MFLTTALFNQVVSEVPGAFGTLRCLLFGGEEVNATMVQHVVAEAPPDHLLHLYGPTENTTFSSCYRVREQSDGAATVPIGKPISNDEIYLLDDHLRRPP